MSASSYSPKYIDVDRVPIAGPGAHSDGEKLDAIEYAEATLEADVNDGNRISDADVESVHSLAVNAYASYILGTGPIEPSSIKAGDFADDGDGRSDFANQMLSMYDRAVASINNATQDFGRNDHTIVSVQSTPTDTPTDTTVQDID